ncbi:MAG: MFS transporter [Polyangiaceae bacterium]
MTEKGHANTALALSTLSFVACFAVWMMNGVLVTFLVDNKVFLLDKAQIGWLMGLPVFSGSLIRLPVGIATDRWGGRVVFTVVMLVSAVGAYAMSLATSYGGLAAGSLAFGLAGTSFSVGIAYTSTWFKKEHQGTALGIFGAGNAGSAVTSLAGPLLLKTLTHGGQDLEAWRLFPRIYAAGLVVMAILFAVFTKSRKVDQAQTKSLGQQLAPLKVVRVWRFGLYYFFVFGGFVALAQWLIPYYVSVYGSSVALAGLLAAIFSLPSGVIRALGGYLSDKLGARTVMYWVFGICGIACLLLMFPRMDVTSPGEGVMATQPGVVTSVSPSLVTVGEARYEVREAPPAANYDDQTLVWPTSQFWQEPTVKVGDKVAKKQLLARGITHVFFQANVWVFTALVFIVGILMGIGKAAVYKHIPEYFPKEVGVVGGVVGVIGGLGGFFSLILFGYLLRATGLWTSCWMFFFVLSTGCLAWMHIVVRRMDRDRAPHVAEHLEDHGHAPQPGGASAKSPVEIATLEEARAGS